MSKTAAVTDGIQPKIFVSYAYDSFMRYILAHRADIEKVFEGQNDYILMQTYAHFLKTKEEQKANPFKLFATVVPQAKHILAWSFKRLLDEVQNISVETAKHINSVTPSDSEVRLIQERYTDSSSRDDAIKELVENKQMSFVADASSKANDASIAAFMFKVVSTTVITRGTNLYAAADPSSYFQTKIVQILTEYKTNMIFMNTIGNLFDRFLKCIAKKVCNLLWEDHRTVNAEFLRGVLRLSEISEGLLAEIVESIPAAVPRKPAGDGAKGKTTAVTTTAAVAAGAVVSATASPVSAEPPKIAPVV